MPTGVFSCGPPAISRFLHNREIFHFSPKHSSVPHHGTHEGCGGHAFCSAGAQKFPARIQHSSQVKLKKDIKSIWFELVLVTSVILHKRACMQKLDPKILSFPLQGSQHDEDCCRTPLWTDGGWVSNKRGADSSTAHDRVGDAEASQNQFSPGSAGEVQEFLPDGQQKRRGGTLWRSPSGYSLLWAAQRLLLRATSWTRLVTTQPTNLRNGILSSFELFFPLNFLEINDNFQELNIFIVT